MTRRSRQRMRPGPLRRPRILVCIPTYDERENLPGTLARLRAAVPEADVLVLDDASPDGTGEIADQIAAQDPQLSVLHRSGKSGLGAAYVAGFVHALEQGYDVVVEMDADGSHTPEELPRLLAALHDADVVLGSRWMPGGEVRNWPRSRLLLSRGGNAYVRTALGMPLTDATGGFRAYRASFLRSLALDTVSSQGYCFQIDLVWRAWRQGRRIVEVPITFVERERGTSKMSKDIVAEALWRVTWWGVQTRRGRSTSASGPAADTADSVGRVDGAARFVVPDAGTASDGAQAVQSTPSTQSTPATQSTPSAQGTPSTQGAAVADGAATADGARADGGTDVVSRAG